MADNTGAPWLLPYPEDTDLVRDGASDIEALAVAVAAGLSSAGSDDASDLTTGTLASARLPAGAILNVVQTVKSNFFSTTSTTFTEITGLSATITPIATSSKILVVVSMSASTSTNDTAASYRLMRDATAIALSDAAGNRERTFFVMSGVITGVGSPRTTTSPGVTFLDTPNTTSATIYSVQVITPGGGSAGTMFLNASPNDPNAAEFGRSISTITLIEVAA